MTFLIIDATAGYRLMWKGKDTRYTVFLDKRLECKPDILCDDRQLPLRDHIADVIVCDPPHLIRATPPPTGTFYRNYINRYGHWKSLTQWINYLHHTNQMFYSSIKPKGQIIMKIMDGNKEYMHENAVTLQHIKNHYTNFRISHIRKYENPLHWLKHKHKSPTIWLTLKPHN
jgi:tRNA G10  N-methylase Trm11